MSTIVVGIYPSVERAQRAVGAIIDAGFPGEAVSVVVQTSLLVADEDLPRLQGYYPEPMLALDDRSNRILISAAGFLAAGPLATPLHRGCLHDTTRAFAGALLAAGLDGEAAGYLDQALRDGAILVAVECDDALAYDARSVLRGRAPSRAAAPSIVGCGADEVERHVRPPAIGHLHHQNSKGRMS